VTAVASLVGASDFWWDVTKIAPGPEEEAKKKAYGERVRRLVDSIDPATRLERIPPKALFVASGRGDPFIDIESMRRVATRMRVLYALTPERFSFEEEAVGHEATDSMRRAASEWLERFLKKSKNPRKVPGPPHVFE
jgi:hypothetical protein